ncbi:unnamed protein product [Paramecium pentaurelia]|uniref:Uncharacterized protein n=1 Tax=Paramecium pentaurelia TaxID=43138 RepID=A0A8S1XFY0_9CILI|nr:unnamed protein product [Paramecium pentaurelia]
MDWVWGQQGNKRIVLRTVGAEAIFVNAHPQPQRTFFKNIFWEQQLR